MKTFIYCNGIENTRQDAMNSASMISELLGDRDVEVFYNPTNISNVLDFSAPRKLIEAELSEELRNVIAKEIMEGREVTLFAHSHGALITEMALERLTPEQRESVDVHAFGGATVIPNSLARTVSNHFHEGDLISEVGNVRYKDRELVLYDHKAVYGKMKEGMSKREAIVSIISERVHMAMFMGRDARRCLANEVERFRKDLCDYNVAISEGPQAPRVELQTASPHASFGEKISVALSNIGTQLVATAQHAQASHGFAAYRQTLEGLVQQL